MRLAGPSCRHFKFTQLDLLRAPSGVPPCLAASPFRVAGRVQDPTARSWRDGGGGSASSAAGRSELQRPACDALRQGHFQCLSRVWPRALRRRYSRIGSHHGAVSAGEPLLDRGHALGHANVSAKGLRGQQSSFKCCARHHPGGCLVHSGADAPHRRQCVPPPKLTRKCSGEFRSGFSNIASPSAGAVLQDTGVITHEAVSVGSYIWAFAALAAWGMNG